MDGREATPTLPPLTSFEMGCYHTSDPSAAEKGGGNGRSYRGLISYTASGRTCKNWNDDNPWKNNIKRIAEPDLEVKGVMHWGNGIGNHNYCRNPDPTNFDKPWCFTSDPTAPIEECNIDPCPENSRSWTEEAAELANKMKATTNRK